MGREVTLSFQIDPVLAACRDAHGVNRPPVGLRLALSSCRLAERTGEPTGSHRKAAATHGSATTPDHCRGDDLRTSRSFVSGNSNRLAAVSAADIVERLGQTSPLVIHGPTGVGKTHLLEGIWTAAKRRYPRLHAVYLSAEQFTSYFLEALHSTGMPNFRNKYRGVELLLIDDLQFFVGKKATLAELQYTIDTLAGTRAATGVRRGSAAGQPARIASRVDRAALGRTGVPHRSAGVRDALGILRRARPSWACNWPTTCSTSSPAVFTVTPASCPGLLRCTPRLGPCRGRSRAAWPKRHWPTWRHARARSVELADVQRAVCDVLGLEPQSLRSGRRTMQSHIRGHAGYVAGAQTHAGRPWPRSANSSAAAATRP